LFTVLKIITDEVKQSMRKGGSSICQ